LGGGGRHTTGRERRRLASILVSVEVALAIVLVIGATLLMRSLWELRRVDPGFETQRLVAARVSLPAMRYGLEQRTAFWTQLLDELGGHPAIEGAATASRLPIVQTVSSTASANRDAFERWGMQIEGHTVPGGSLEIMIGTQISPTYLDVIGIPLVRGRRFSEADRAGAPLVAYVDATAVERFWVGRDPIGTKIRYPGGGEWLTVIGVVGAVKARGLTVPAEPTFYVPLTQTPVTDPTLTTTMTSETVVLRATDAGRAIEALRSTVSRLAPDAPISDVRTLEERLSATLATQRSALTLLGAFAAVALLLGAVGTYGVMASVTVRRTRELALRLALGAEPARVIAIVTRQGAVLGIAGAAGGVVLALGLTSLLRNMLFGVSERDPLSFVAVPLLLAAVTVLASWIPARRVARIDPAHVLRDE
jgi:putative ABC transport system permease protein